MEWNAMQAPGDLMYKRAKQGFDLFGNVMTGGILRGAGNFSTPSLPAPRPTPRGYLPYKR